MYVTSFPQLQFQGRAQGPRRTFGAATKPHRSGAARRTSKLLRTNWKKTKVLLVLALAEACRRATRNTR